MDTNAADPAPPAAGYDEALHDLKGSVRSARLVAQRRVNAELVRLYWSIGTTLNAHVERHRWGSAVMKRMADDLRREFPDMRGFSARNLCYMRALARMAR
jgi:predicted nuclease of restriction endonuclease-like (RecB) superfamily